MAQTTILAAGSTSADSSDVVVAAGAVVTVGIFRDAGDLPDYAGATVMLRTPGAAIPVAVLDDHLPATTLAAPGTYYVARRGNSFAVNIGVFSDT